MTLTRPDVAKLLYDAALSGQQDAVNAAIAAVRDWNVSDDALADLYLPQVVRKLGTDWADDRVSWAQVTIGTARLQSVLRRIGRRIDPRSARHSSAPTILLVTGRDTAHTFGPMLLAHQLRRRGVSVTLSLDTDVGDVCERFRRNAPDAVFISAAHSDRVVILSQIIKEVRVFNAGVPIVVGGPLIDDIADLGTRIGADVATSDLDHALSECGLKHHLQSTPA